ncbi:hypothetical protein [Streptomyces sp. CAI-85]|uniref:hypothetical protein n=1 Tax=Streptomyces sp. CAI-85 TaxID=1472662 RepID=UPI0015870397|nr:hypothetical protein [Streptomyces sp. CAI-85]NUV60083.1 hypothetical protein [Streptomyces sp. CAI-85]
MDWQDETMRALRERAESLPAGWVMYTNVVDAEHLPDGFARGEREEFDAVAVGPGGGIVFEVLRQRSAASRVKIAHVESIRKRLNRFSGWDVEVIILPQSPRLAQGDEIDKRLQTVAELVTAGESTENQEVLRAAFVLAFSVLEWTMARYFEGGVERRPLSVSQMAEKMVSEGLLPGDLYRDIRELQAARSQIVHGLSVTAQIDGDAIRHVSEVAEVVNAELAKVQT